MCSHYQCELCKYSTVSGRVFANNLGYVSALQIQLRNNRFDGALVLHLFCMLKSVGLREQKSAATDSKLSLAITLSRPGKKSYRYFTENSLR